MNSKALSISVVMLSLATSAALAAGLTEKLQSDRMTITKLDRNGAQFYCAEHHRWTRVSKTAAAGLTVGDIVSIDRDGESMKVRVVRTAADELGSPE
jgi:hypothetical protein